MLTNYNNRLFHSSPDQQHLDLGEDVAVAGCGSMVSSQRVVLSLQCKTGPEGKFAQKLLILQSFYLGVVWAGNSLVRKHRLSRDLGVQPTSFPS